MSNFLRRHGFHKFTQSFCYDDVVFVACVRCGESKIMHAFLPDDGDPEAVPEENNNILAFVGKTA